MSRLPNRKQRLDFYHLDIPTKANRILQFILISMLLLLIRIWYLSIAQYDQKLEEAHKPQRNTIITPSTRATIRDRFNLPLAINRISYQATILYSQIKDIPTFEWQENEQGQRVKIYKRKEYVQHLSQLLAAELDLDAERVEDLIYSKASYYSQVPFVVKDDLSEGDYYKLKALEKDWPGIHVRRLPKRFYPFGRVAADVIGYMGAINQVEYEKILHEMKALKQFIHQQENDEDVEPLPHIQTIQQARKRLKDLEAKAYTIHDYVGKTGIEGVYEEQLRGFYGKKTFYSNSKGRFLYELPGARYPLPGQRVLLTLSAELQEYAEKLLAQNEELRIVRKSRLGPVKKTVKAEKEPWIKGGSIVVMEPYTGELLTLASYPRYDPNDFILEGDVERKKEKKNHINRWLENDFYLAQVWNQQQPIKRERYDLINEKFYDEERWLTWQTYLNFILPVDGSIHQTIFQVQTIRQAVNLQNQIDLLTDLFPDYSLYDIFNHIYVGDEHTIHRQHLKNEERQKLKKLIDQNDSQVQSIKTCLFAYLDHLSHQYNKVLLVDLCRLAVCHTAFTPELIKKVGSQTLSDYHDQCSSLTKLTDITKAMMKDLFHDLDFKRWRKENEKDFLKIKRQEEKERKTYAKPYLDYFDKQENVFFNDFWQTYRWDCLLALLTGIKSYQQESSEGIKDIEPYLDYLCHWHDELEQGAHQNVGWKNSYDQLRKALAPLTFIFAKEYLQTMRSYEELNRPLFGHYRYLKKSQPLLEKHLAAAFYPLYGFGYGRSHAFRQAAIQGSLFKLVTAYEVLIQRFKKMGHRIVSYHDLNPLIMIDEVYKLGNVQYVGYTEDGKPIPQLYKGGRLPRSLAHRNNGRVDLIKAFEMSSNPYFSLLAGEHLEEPSDLARAAQLFSFGKRTGIDLPAEIAGKVPEDLETNRTGLYAMAIGQHALVVTPLQTAVMLAAIANGGKVLKPKIVNLTVGYQSSPTDNQIICLPTFPYQDTLALVGIDFPLFSASTQQNQQSLVKNIPVEVKRTLEMPEIVRQTLLKGLRAASQRTYQDNLNSLIHLYRSDPTAIQEFKDYKDLLLGKTSTSESVENLDLDLEDGTNIYTHVWFGSIAFDQSQKNKTIFLLKDEFGHPELIIVVYLRYGGYGKEAAPLASQILKKWQEIKAKYAKNNFASTF